LAKGKFFDGGGRIIQAWRRPGVFLFAMVVSMIAVIEKLII
jgi:hypothetical protein